MQQIINVTTSDDRTFYGLLTAPEQKTDKILINIHGTASNFYIEDFLPVITEQLSSQGIATLATNNRGADALKGWEPGGASEEMFEDCLLDIDCWIERALRDGYEQIYLSGHSLGTEKVVYYMANGRYKDRIKAVILLSPADSFGTEMDFLKDQPEALLNEAKTLVNSGKGREFLRSIWLSHAGVLPQSAESFLNFFSPGSELSKVFPLRDRELVNYRKITVPILATISDDEEDEYTIIPIKEALELLEKENPRTKTVLLNGTDHNYTNKERELAEVIGNFLSKI